MTPYTTDGPTFGLRWQAWPQKPRHTRCRPASDDGVDPGKPRSVASRGSRLRSVRHPPTDLNPERGMRVRGLTVALLFLTATAASAQTAGSYEIDGFGRNTRFDDALALNNRFGGGGA